MNPSTEMRKMYSIPNDLVGQLERPKKKIRVFSPIQSIAALTATGTSTFNDGNYQEARYFFSRALCRMNVSYLRSKLGSETSEKTLMQGSSCKPEDAHVDQSTKAASTATEYDEGMKVYTNAIPLHNECQPDLIPTILCYNIAQTYSRERQQIDARKWFGNALDTLKKRGNSSSESTVLLVKVLSCLGYSSYRCGDEEWALKLYQQCLTLVREIDFGTKLHTAAALNCVGVLLFNKQNKNPDQVLDLFEQSLHLYRSENGSSGNQAEIATVLNNIGRARYLRFEFDEALAVYGEALEIRRQHLGSLSIDVAATVYNIGQAYLQLKKYDQSLQCFTEFLSIAKSVVGEASRDAALVYKAIAEIYQEKNDLKSAHKFLNLALDAQKAFVGRCSPEVATTLNKLGNLCYEMKDFQSAMRYYSDGLVIERAALPVGHQHIVITITNIAHIHKHIGDHAKALKAYEQVRRMQVKAFGKDDVQVADTLSSIGLMQYHLRNFESSFESYQEALRIRRQNLGTDNHSDIASTLNSIGLVLFKRDMFELAKSCFNESLRIRCKILGKDHRDVAILWYNIATIHFETGDDEIAIKMYEETLRVERAALGDDHPDVILTLQHLGQVYQQLGHIEKALAYFESALDIERRRNGSKRTMGRILNLLGNVYLQLGKTESMMRCYVEASRIYESDQQASETLVVAGYNLYGLSKTNPSCAPTA